MSRIHIRDMDRWLTRLTREKGAKTALKGRRVLSTMFSAAHQRGLIANNPVTGSLVPRTVTEELQPFEVDEVILILNTAETVENPMPSRWGVALSMGLRQGECLGLRIEDLDILEGTLTVAGQLQQVPWRHGCTSASQEPRCGKRRACDCPDRFGGGLQRVSWTKSQAGYRRLVIPDPLLRPLVQHLELQEQRAAELGDKWANRWDLLFTTPTGHPINPSKDSKAWHDLLDKAGVRQMRLHGARHTAATNYMGLVDPRIVQGLMGWASPAMLGRYQHVSLKAQRQAARALSEHLWGGQE